MFIKINIDKSKCKNEFNCIKCIDICSVKIFKKNNGLIEVNCNNEDECTLCNLCINICPLNAIKVEKLY